MGKIPKKINSIAQYYICGNKYEFEYTKDIHYVINENEETETKVLVQLPNYVRPKKSNKISEDSNDFINGFKVVRTSNGEYAYVREVDNSLMPYRYDIATDFNEYGYAMVAKDGKVSWINKNFEYLNSKGKMVKENLNQVTSYFDGWEKVQDFSKSSVPLSLIWDGDYLYEYFGTDGKIKEFYKYDGEVDKNFKRDCFTKGMTFNEKGYATSDDAIIFDKGYYITYEDLLRLSVEKGFLNELSEDAQRSFNDKEKTLKKEYKQGK